jgi:hypothetical protein
MLAGELTLTGVRTLVLEKRPEISQVAKAGGLSGRRRREQDSSVHAGRRPAEGA